MFASTLRRRAVVCVRNMSSGNPLSPEEVTMLKSSFALVAKDAEGFTSKFYGHLFETNPHLKPLFKGDMKAQGRNLAGMLAAAVNSADKLADVVPAVVASGKRHVDYGVTKADYDAVGASLIHTLQTSFGPAFTPELKALWVKTYGIIASVMTAQHPK